MQNPLQLYIEANVFDLGILPRGGGVRFGLQLMFTDLELNIVSLKGPIIGGYWNGGRGQPYTPIIGYIKDLLSENNRNKQCSISLKQ